MAQALGTVWTLRPVWSGPRKIVNVHTIRDCPVLEYPDSVNPGNLKMLASGTSVEVWDNYIPDSQGFGSENKKWYPLSNGQGFVNKNDITEVSERQAVGVFYDQYFNRKIKFDDGTVLTIPEPPDTYTVPSTGTYARFAFDWERPDWDYKPRTRSAAPQTVPMWDKPDFYTLTEDWQNLWFDLIKWAAHSTLTDGQLLTAWADITTERKALTDNHGLSHQFTDYILGLFLDNNKPIMQKGLGMGGNLVRIRYGSTIFALDPSKPAPSLDWLLERPYLWGWCNSITRDSKSVKWPNLSVGNFNVPYFHLGYEEKNTIKAEHLIKLKAGETFSPYV